MSKIKPATWIATHAATGLKDLPRNGAWLLSKALKSPVVATGSAAHEASDGFRRVRSAVAEKVPGIDPVGMKLKRAEAAVASAKEVERTALAEAQAADERADAAKAIGEAGRQRVREATREGREEVERRTRAAREHFNRLVEQERENASQDVEEAIRRIMAEAEADANKARDDAARVTERAQTMIDDAHEQMAEARALVADATAAAEGAADQAREQARAIADRAEQRTGSAERAVEDARRAGTALKGGAASAVQAEQSRNSTESLADHTKAELLELAQPLDIPGAARMNKGELVRAIRRASRAQQRRS